MKSLPAEINGPMLVLKKHSVVLAYIMFEEIDKDRERLGQFLPWVEHMKSVDSQIWYINECTKDWSEGTMFDYGMFNLEGDYIGNFGVHSISWADDRCELGYWISPRFEGRGFISTAVKMLEKILFELGFNRIEIRCDPKNLRSGAVPARNGYKFEGVLRGYQFQSGHHRDTAVHAKLRNEYSA
ncbi:MAG: GNAT family N-acetyltransferase [Bdellovibrionaceae bacterium]|nr:GNAT family N-acetyltransferase [Pseudobdellovibrionaceae bacterium]